jgi:hypothetical protein
LGEAPGKGRVNPKVEEGRNVENSVRVGKEANSGCEFERAVPDKVSSRT